MVDVVDDAVADPVDEVCACALLDVAAGDEEDPDCEEDAFVAMARADWEIWAEEREGVPVDWEEAL